MPDGLRSLVQHEYKEGYKINVKNYKGSLQNSLFVDYGMVVKIRWIHAVKLLDAPLRVSLLLYSIMA